MPGGETKLGAAPRGPYLCGACNMAVAASSRRHVSARFPDRPASVPAAAWLRLDRWCAWAQLLTPHVSCEGGRISCSPQSLRVQLPLQLSLTLTLLGPAEPACALVPTHDSHSTLKSGFLPSLPFRVWSFLFIQRA